MGFFKDFKEDFSDAVDELIPGDSGDVEAENKTSSEVPLDTDSSDINVQDELNKLDGLLEQVSKKVDANGPLWQAVVDVTRQNQYMGYEPLVRG